ncbi:PilW family protein [Geothrix edaphica]|uniref:Prepilin-type N-terminal cleavage/methylation domain-containing protein n=1 Tax=Geothrix edaphica TaxID=2927976 RepID=A0ABQ5PZI0_9BACT|nr:prepilin-type N-terminal cleavage/methylation domain-containing protein [Geothrix edaphica]GLH67764.1 hypothetical protein GETHED_21280 [Geothrix edaphica]
MSDSNRTLLSRRCRGFSLVEMLVAVVFTSILMAGMFRVFASSTASFAASTETLSVQRKARWGLTLLQDEVLEAGHLFFKRVVGELIPNSDTAQPPILMRTTDFTPPGGVSPVDELQFVMDLPLNVQGTLRTAPVIGDSKLSVNVLYGGDSLKKDDLIFIQDSNWEVYRISADPSTSGNTNFDIDIVGTQSALVDQYGNETSSIVHALVQKTHRAKAQFTAFRPLQVVRYAVVPRKLDPASPTATVPCLVRQTQPLAGNANVIFSPAQATEVNGEQILLENVSGFYVNWSLDGGNTWLRTSATAGSTEPPWAASTDWGTLRAALNAKLASSSSPLTQQALGGTSTEDPFWMNYTPVLIRIDIETRSEIQRTEFNASSSATNPQLAFRKRRETLYLSPRNFSLGRP